MIHTDCVSVCWGVGCIGNVYTPQDYDIYKVYLWSERERGGERGASGRERNEWERGERVGERWESGREWERGESGRETGESGRDSARVREREERESTQSSPLTSHRTPTSRCRTQVITFQHQWSSPQNCCWDILSFLWQFTLQLTIHHNENVPMHGAQQVAPPDTHINKPAEISLLYMCCSLKVQRTSSFLDLIYSLTALTQYLFSLPIGPTFK